MSSVSPSAPISPEPQKSSNEKVTKVAPEVVSTAIDMSAKLEVLKAIQVAAKGKRPIQQEDSTPEKVAPEMKISNTPLSPQNRTEHLASVETSIKWLESEISKGGHEPEHFVELEYTLEKAQSTRGHLIQMENKPEHAPAAQAGLQFLANFKI